MDGNYNGFTGVAADEARKRDEEAKKAAGIKNAQVAGMPAEGLSPENQAAWMQMQQQLANARGETESLRQADIRGPEQQYSPVTKDPVTGEIKLRKELQLSGPQNFIQQALAKQQLEEAGQRDLAAQSLTQGLAQNRAQMAMRGGSRSGAQANLQRQGLKELMASRQGVAQRGAMDRANLGLQGEEMGRKTEAYNLENMLKGGEGADSYALKMWQTKKAAEAAKNSAAATRAAAQDSSKK